MIVHLLIPLFAALLSTTLAQTPPGYQPSSNTNLEVTYANGVEVTPPGVLLTIAETAKAPTLTASGAESLSSTYMVFMIDIDVPVSATVSTTVLQWYLPGLTINKANEVLSSSSTAGSSYAGPAPPANGPPHRYVFLLFTQPSGYKLPSCYASITGTTVASRLGFNIEEFLHVAGLGPPVAANYFKAENGKPSATTATVTSTSYSAASCTPTGYGGGGGWRKAIKRG